MTKGYKTWIAWEAGLRSVMVGWVLVCLVSLSPARAQGLDLGPVWQDLMYQRGLDPEMQPQRLGKMMAWATAESLYVMPIDLSCPLALCSECGAGQSKPQAYRLPFASPNGLPVPFGIVKSEGGSDMGSLPGRATLVFALPNGDLFKTTAAWNSTGVEPLVWKSGSLPGVPAAGVPALVLPAADFDGSNDSAALVLGSNGLGLRVTWTAASVAATALPLPKDDYTARGGKYFGSAGGVVYRFDPYPILNRVAQPLVTRIRALDSTGALGANGDFLFVRNGRWYASPQRTSAKARAWKVRWGSDGLSARVWSGSPTPEVLKLPEAQSVIQSTAPSQWLRNVNGAAIPFQSGEPMEIRIVTGDSDGGYAAPVFRRIRSRDTLVLTQHFRPGIPGFGFMGNVRATGCALTGMCLQGEAPSLTIRLRADSVAVSAPVLAGGLNMQCPNNMYMSVRDSAWRSGTDLRAGDRLEFIIAADTLRFEVGITDRLVHKPAGGLYRKGISVRFGFDATGREMAIGAGDGGVKAGVSSSPRFLRTSASAR